MVEREGGREDMEGRERREEREEREERVLDMHKKLMGWNCAKRSYLSLCFDVYLFALL